MRLADLRRLAVRQNLKIRFPLPGGAECVVDERGVARVPGLSGIPEFNLEREAGEARSFTLDGEVARTVSREELARMAGAAPATQEHEEE